MRTLRFVVDAQFQSTFPRGERQDTTYMDRPHLMFQSTFPRGERPVKGGRPLLANKFQSTFPRGERRTPRRCISLRVHVSIHVPARGTTRRAKSTKSHYFGFNPRSREGNDFYAPNRLLWDGWFQSTFPRGERRKNSKQTLTSCMFQSTFPRGERRWRSR